MRPIGITFQDIIIGLLCLGVIVGVILVLIWSLVSLAVSAIRKSRIPHNRDEDGYVT